MASWSFEKASRWIEKAETQPIQDLSWDDLRAALEGVRQGDPQGGPGDWVDRVLALVHAKAAPLLEDMRQGVGNPDTITELSKAVQAVKPASSVGGDPEFLDQVSKVVRDAQATQSLIEHPPASPAAEATKPREQIDAIQGLKSQFLDAGRRFYEATGKFAGQPQFQMDFQLEQDFQSVQQAGQAAGITPQDAIRQQIAGWEDALISSATANAIAPGSSSATLPAGFMASKEIPVDPQRIALLGAEAGRRVDVKPQFVAGDEFSPAMQGPEFIAELQQRMVDAGLMKENDFYAGWWDPNSTQAYRQVLGYANLSGKSPSEVLDQLKASGVVKNGQANMQVFQAEPFVKPDYATLAQSTKQMMRSQLGRDPTPEEMAQLSTELGGFYRSQYEAQVAASRQLATATQKAQETGTEQPAGVIQGVDPAARFAELFDKRFAPERARLESLDPVRQNMSNLFGTLGTLTSAIGGS